MNIAQNIKGESYLWRSRTEIGDRFGHECVVVAFHASRVRIRFVLDGYMYLCHRRQLKKNNMKDPIYSVNVTLHFSANDYRELIAKMQMIDNIAPYVPVDSSVKIDVNGTLTSTTEPVPQSHDEQITVEHIETPAVAFVLKQGLYNVYSQSQLGRDVGAPLGSIELDHERAWRYDIHDFTYFDADSNPINVPIYSIAMDNDDVVINTGIDLLRIAKQ